MKRLQQCLNKLVGKLIDDEQASSLLREVEELEKEGYTPSEAETFVIKSALKSTQDEVDSVIRQITDLGGDSTADAIRFVTKKSPTMPLNLVPKWLSDLAELATLEGITVDSLLEDVPDANSWKALIEPLMVIKS